MFKKPLHNGFLALAAGMSVFLAFEKFAIVPAILFFPGLITHLFEKSKNLKAAFLWGFLVSFVIMCGGFYWIVYVIHEFGYLPWSVSVLLFLGFCGFGALNFPLYSSLAFLLNTKLQPHRFSKTEKAIWYAFLLPALFTLLEFLIPKLFPWYIGHCLYQQLWLIQLIEWTGSSLLTFTLFSLGSALYGQWKAKKEGKNLAPFIFVLPITLIGIQILFSTYRLMTFENDGRLLKTGLIQANIGSLEKVSAEQGTRKKVEYVVNEHVQLSESLLQQDPKIDLLVWPETAMPFIVTSLSEMPTLVRKKVEEWKVPLITGGYAQSKTRAWRDYNTAYFLTPHPDQPLTVDNYNKNILLAFGEYLPFQDTFPWLLKQFPQIGGFDVGTEQNSFLLSDGTRLGITICYEAILPTFYRKSLKNGIHAMVNLTNDSWFGPTAEPYLHGSLTVFRAIESRVPLLRVTNTGVSFGVDSLGHRSPLTPVYDKGSLIVETRLPQKPPLTLYTRFGDWFILVLMVLFVLSTRYLWKKHHASISL